MTDKEKQQIESIKIGIIDTGIDPKFSDFCLDKRKIEKRHDKNAIKLEDNIIQAKYFDKIRWSGYLDEMDSSYLDIHGHGSECASVAAGRKIERKLFGAYPVTIEGAAPLAEIYAYKVVWKVNKDHLQRKNRRIVAEYDDIVAAFEAAIEDKVDVISISIKFDLKAISKGSFLAMKSNILTVAACGNDGPKERTVVNVAPWILTVGACEPKQLFQAIVVICKKEGDVMVGEKKFKGSSLNLSETKWLPFEVLPLQPGGARDSQDTKEKELVNGKIVLCDSLDDKEWASEAGAEGILYQVSDKTTPYAEYSRDSLSVWLPSCEAQKIHDYIRDDSKSETSFLAKICKTIIVDNPEPKVADFSSRGPNPEIAEILKPDLCAPGIEIPVPSLDEGEYTIKSGTSYACPLVAGKAALIKREFQKKSLNPSPAWIQSALMTTAYNPPYFISSFEKGAGFLDFDKAKDPGLVYDRSVDDYEKLNQWLKTLDTRLNEIYEGYRNKAEMKPWELNYPSIMVKIPRGETKFSLHIPRRLTYVGTTISDYEVVYEADVKYITKETPSIDITIEPKKLHFSCQERVKKFNVILNVVDRERWTDSWFEASLVWKNGNQTVTSPIVLMKE